ncbi:MAG TPA: hypothetical protein DHV30_02605 [Balneola sp.]|nr:hypothetical protein [Balneola sp.]
MDKWKGIEKEIKTFFYSLKFGDYRIMSRTFKDFFTYSKNPKLYLHMKDILHLLTEENLKTVDIKDIDWKTKNLIRVKLGDKTVRFNKQFAKKLQDAYQEAITESGLEDFGFKPVAYTARRIGSKPTDPLSTHALGIGIDFYVPAKTFSNKLAYWKETQFAMGMGNRDYDDIAKENKLEVTEEMKEKILNFREKYKKFVAAMKRNGFRAGADFTRDSKFGDPSHFEVSIEKLLN